VALIIMKKDPLFTPRVANREAFKSLARQRVKWMGD
jgi:hypothetical protein